MGRDADEARQTYWEKIDWALNKETGVGVVQGITIPEARFEQYMREVDFIRKWVRTPPPLPRASAQLLTHKHSTE